MSITLVLKVITKKCANKKLPVVYQAIPNGDHRGALGHSPKYTAEFLKSLQLASIAKAYK
ncbi:MULTISPECIES: hypothetical protein [unclassified Acinetobacter]|uniref:hypothetical protein n=1 Tax=unclassified Acinetobacter TaxID=196816 RepID=UPI0015D224BA